MSSKVAAFISYGQGGAGLNTVMSFDGTGRLATKVRALGVETPGPYTWDQAVRIADRIKALPPSTRVVVGGTSLGANEAPRVGALLGSRPVDFMFGIQPSLYGVRNLVTSNVKRALFIHNPAWWPFNGGLGSYQWQRASGNRTTVMVAYETYAPHPGDGFAWVHDIVLAEIKKLLAA